MKGTFVLESKQIESVFGCIRSDPLWKNVILLIHCPLYLFVIPFPCVFALIFVDLQSVAQYKWEIASILSFSSTENLNDSFVPRFFDLGFFHFDFLLYFLPSIVKWWDLCSRVRTLWFDDVQTVNVFCVSTFESQGQILYFSFWMEHHVVCEFHSVGFELWHQIQIRFLFELSLSFVCCAICNRGVILNSILFENV